MNLSDFRYVGTLDLYRELVKKLPRVQIFMAKAPPVVEQAYPEGPRVVDYIGLIRTPNMTPQELRSHLRTDVEKYAPDCAKSVRRNQHMNEFDGHVLITAAEVKPWLDGFCDLFASRYKGPQSTGDVAMGMVKCARVWRSRSDIEVWTNLGHADQDTRDAVLTDFINFTAGRRGVDFALYSKDLKESEPGDEAYR